MIGDRYFTDVAFGNRYGMLTIRVKPFTNQGDNVIVKLIVRQLENANVSRWGQRGIVAPEHRLYHQDIQYK